jgi:hypothetical protein
VKINSKKIRGDYSDKRLNANNECQMTRQPPAKAPILRSEWKPDLLCDFECYDLAIPIKNIAKIK